MSALFLPQVLTQDTTLSYSHHILVSLYLWQLLSFSLFFVTITDLRSMNQVFCRLSLGVDLSDVFFSWLVGVIGFGKECHRGEVPLSLCHFRVICNQQDLFFLKKHLSKKIIEVYLIYNVLFQVYSKVIQLQYISLFRFFLIIDYYKILSSQFYSCVCTRYIVPFLVVYFIYSSVYMFIPNSWFPPLPFGNC